MFICTARTLVMSMNYIGNFYPCLMNLFCLENVFKCSGNIVVI